MKFAIINRFVKMQGKKLPYLQRFSCYLSRKFFQNELSPRKLSQRAAVSLVNYRFNTIIIWAIVELLKSWQSQQTNTKVSKEWIADFKINHLRRLLWPMINGTLETKFEGIVNTQKPATEKFLWNSIQNNWKVEQLMEWFNLDLTLGKIDWVELLRVWSLMVWSINN